MTLSMTVLSAKCHYAECRYAECGVFYCYAKCHYAECRYAECRGAQFRWIDNLSLSVISKPFLILINLTKCFIFIWIKSDNADLRYEWFLEEKKQRNNIWV